MTKRHIRFLVIFSALIPTPHTYTHAQPSAHVVYSNKQYGFTFALPASWKGYTIQTVTWEGTALPGGGTGSPPHASERGPVLRIRNPQWTEADPHEDIPIWIFTRDQWNRMQNGGFIVGAAPFPPEELGHNARFVFALLPRYFYDYLPGYEEVLKINANHPLHPF